MKNYIVRIYRRNEAENSVAGMVEVVDTQEKKPFHTHEELLVLVDLAKPGVKIERGQRSPSLWGSFDLPDRPTQGRSTGKRCSIKCTDNMEEE